MKSKVIKVIALLLITSVNLQAQEINTVNLDEKRSEPIQLTYKIINDDSLNLIFRYPPNFNSSKKYPTIIFFFGGGWNGGNITQFKPQAEYFALRGMITVLADYRVKKKDGTTPYESVKDAKSAIRFLRKYASDLNIDSERIVASGGSAGGHLASAVGNLPKLDEEGEDLNISSKANALVLFNPVLDNGPDGFQNERMGERWKEISPAHNIKKGAPPTIVFLGKKDHLIPTSIVENYRTKMESVGSRCDLHLYDDAKHGFFNNYKYDGEFYIKTVREADLFLISLNYLVGKPQIAKDIFVSPLGNDSGNGTKSKPFSTIERALKVIPKFAGKERVNVWFYEGTYYLNETIKLGSEYSGTIDNPVIFSALPGARVTIKGSNKFEHLNWTEYQDGIFVTQLPEKFDFDQLFINGERQVRARFPNYDYQNPIRGGKGYQLVTGGTNLRYDTWFSYNPDIFSKQEWKNPETGVVHAFQSHNWGNLQYRVKGIDRKNNKILLAEGGWQLQRKYGIGGKDEKQSWFFIENIFEELDTPGEWFYDKDSKQLYYFPPVGARLKDATVEIPIVKDLIQLIGNSKTPVKNIQFKGFNFTHSKYTYMEKYEPLARGDWAIHRGGAIFMEGAENCIVENCSFKYLGGNGVFMSSFNRNNEVRNCEFMHIGESGVCFVGSPSAVRFYQTWDDAEIYGKDWAEMRNDMDLEAGPKSPDYPKNCVVENSVMHDFGEIGKQVAGVYISMSHKIRVSHNTIYNCPRAGICINDGTWGGHIIEHCDIWETVRETGEHGPFNSWGRERQWRGSRGLDEHFIKELTRLDAIDNVIIRNNRIANYRKSISAGNWTIDLDDGSSYFEIYNNLNLGSTIKLRDGIFRKVYNNITVSAVPLGWHVWPKKSQDEIYQNIFVITGKVPGKEKATRNFIRPVALPKETKWSNNYDNNLYWNINYQDDFLITENLNMEEWKKEGYDAHSIVGDPNFVDPQNGNYQVKDNSPALELGFKNIPMDEFGHQMTRILPLGGEFVAEINVNLKADERAGKSAKVFFTLDGSEPTIHSLEYTSAIKINNSTKIKARTFDSNGIPVGFTMEAFFVKVRKIEHPSWYTTLLAGKYLGVNEIESENVLEIEVLGALMVNIAEDPDLIDATGGYNYGCYIKSIDSMKVNIWEDAGLSNDWVIQKLNEHKVNNTYELQKYLKNYEGQKVTITAVRDYGEKKFEVQL